MFKNAFSGVPSKPALILAPVLVVLVLSLYYRDQYIRCVDVKQTRAALSEQLHALGSPAQFRLVDFTDFDWTKVRIVASVERDTINDTCPLEWNWPRGEREALIDSGRLAVLIFGQQGRIVKYMELRGDEVEFLGAEGHLSPQEAVFDVVRKVDGNDGFKLTLNK